MRAQQPTRRGASLATRACIAGALAAAAHAAPAAAAPAPCGGVAQIADAAGDGHHDNTDVTAAWLSEAGRPPAGGDPATGRGLGAGARRLRRRRLRAALHRRRRRCGTCAPIAPRGPAQFDHGTWSAAGGFASAGPTTGQTVAGAGGTVTIDVPARRRRERCSRGCSRSPTTAARAPTPHWVDRAPGGAATPDGTEFGADYVVGCVRRPGTGTPRPAGGAVTTTAVELDAPRRIVGGGRTRSAGASRPPAPASRVQVTATRPPLGRAPRGHAGRRLVLAAAADRRDDARARGRRVDRLADAHDHGPSRRCGSASAGAPAARPSSGARSARGCRAACCCSAAAPSRPPPRRRRATGASASASPIRAPAATRPSSSRAATVPSGPRPTQESSDEVHSASPARSPSPPRSRRPRRRPPIRRSTRATRRSSTTDPADVSTPQTRYVVANHGFTYVLRESNGARRSTAACSTTSRSRAPYRGRRSRTGTTSQRRRDRRAGARHVPRRRARDRGGDQGWQGTDPFYAYVPFQKAVAGLEDDPATWIPKVKELTAARSTSHDRTAAARRRPARRCPARRDSYVPADATQSTQRGVQLRPASSTRPSRSTAEIAGLKTRRGTARPR